MPEKRNTRKKIKARLFTKNRLVILNEDSFAEIFSLRLTLMNVFVLATLGAIVIIFVTSYIIAFTPLREYIPGYASDDLKRNATSLAIESDSIQKSLAANNAYLNSIKKVLRGELDLAKLDKDSITPDTLQVDPEILKAGENEKNLRQSVQKDEQYSLSNPAAAKAGLTFFSPVSAEVVRKFDPTSGSNGISFKTAKGTPVKATLKGTVIFAGFSIGSGNTVIIRHANGFTSVLKNLGDLTADVSDKVRAGQVVGMSASEPIEFELYKEETAVNPQQFLE